MATIGIGSPEYVHMQRYCYVDVLKMHLTAQLQLWLNNNWLLHVADNAAGKW